MYTHICLFRRVCCTITLHFLRCDRACTHTETHITYTPGVCVHTSVLRFDCTSVIAHTRARPQTHTHTHTKGPKLGQHCEPTPWMVGVPVVFSSFLSFSWVLMEFVGNLNRGTFATNRVGKFSATVSLSGVRSPRTSSPREAAPTVSLVAASDVAPEWKQWIKAERPRPHSSNLPLLRGVKPRPYRLIAF